MLARYYCRHAVRIHSEVPSLPRGRTPKRDEANAALTEHELSRSEHRRAICEAIVNWETAAQLRKSLFLFMIKDLNPKGTEPAAASRQMKGGGSSLNAR